jgi:alpha-tubulin suppressor-like RCC1 family protein
MCVLLQQMAASTPDASGGNGSSSGGAGSGSTSGGGPADSSATLGEAFVAVPNNAPANLSGSSLNFALVTQTTGACISPGQCFVPIENDSTDLPTDGWVVTDGIVQMAPGICTKLSKPGVQLFAVYGSCASKVEAAPVCEPTAGSSSQLDGGTSADASGRTDGGSSGGTVDGPDGSVPVFHNDASAPVGDSGTTPQPTTPLVGVTAIAAGSFHTCAVLASGVVDCWGLNSNGQLGNGSTAESSTPVAVKGALPEASAITAGVGHTCLLTTGGSVQCWGDNSTGQLGNGGTGQSLVPVTVPTLPGAIAIAAGADFTCALLSDTSVQCWGDNSTGQLGNGGTTESPTPVPVSGLTNVTAIAAGGSFACAISGGSVECWGSDQDGQLGDGTMGTSSPTPVAVATVTNATAIAAGSLHACAVLGDGSVQCWGDNSNGQLGDGTLSIELTPGPTSPLQGQAFALAGGNLHTCAVLTGGPIECWGENNIGQLGNGTAAQSEVPVLVQAPASSASAVAAGQMHTCAIVANGGVECWGSNQDGQLGAQNPQTLQSLTPAPVYTTAVP